MSLEAKWKLYEAECRFIQSYAVQVRGDMLFKEVNKLQFILSTRFFIYWTSSHNAIMLQTRVNYNQFICLICTFLYKINSGSSLFLT